MNEILRVAYEATRGVKQRLDSTPGNILSMALSCSVLGTAVTGGIVKGAEQLRGLSPDSTSACSRTFEDRNPIAFLRDKIDPEKYQRYLANGYEEDGNGGLIHIGRQNGVTSEEVNYFLGSRIATDPIPTPRSGVLCEIPLGASVEDGHGAFITPIP